MTSYITMPTSKSKKINVLWRRAAIYLALVIWPLPSFSYELADAMHFTLQQNQQIQALKEDLHKSKLDVNRAVATFLPDISATKTTVNTHYNDDIIGNRRNNVESIGANMTLFQSGAKFANYKAAKHAYLAADNSYKAQVENILVNVVNAYASYLTAVEILDIARKREKLLKSQLELNKVRFQYGDIPKTDLLQAESAYASSLSSLEGAKGELATAKAVLEGITYDFEIPSKIKDINMLPLQELLPKSLEEFLAAAKLYNPSLLSSQSSLDSARAGLYVSATTILPKITGSFEYFKDFSSIASGSIANRDLKGNRATLTFSIPILPNGGAGFIDVKKAKADRNKAEASLRRAKVDVDTEVIRTWSEYESAVAVSTAAAVAVVAEGKTLDGFQEEAKAGSRDIIQVLEVEQRYNDAQLTQARATRNKVVNAFKILALLGRLQTLDYSSF